MNFELLIGGLVLGIWFVDRLVAQARTDRGIVARELARAAVDAAGQQTTIEEV